MSPPAAPRVDVSHLAPIRVSVAEAMEELAAELSRSGPVTFRRLTAGLAERIEVIVHFLGVLELYKQGLVELDQAATFGDLTVAWVGGTGGLPVAAGVDAYEG
jgi:segregation and condensation protein A